MLGAMRRVHTVYQPEMDIQTREHVKMIKCKYVILNTVLFPP